MSDINTRSLRLPAWVAHLPRAGIAQKIGAVFIILLALATVNIVVVERMMKAHDSVADTVNIAGKLRMLGQRVALQAVNHVQGIGAGESEVRQLMRDFEVALAGLTHGGYVYGMYVNPLATVHDANVEAVAEHWTAYRRVVLQLLNEVRQHRATAGSLPAATVRQPDSVNMLVEETTNHSLRLLQAAETLMNSIVESTHELDAATMHRMYLLLAANVVLILLAFMAVRRQIVVPLRELSTHCRELAAGNYNTRFEVSTQDEIGQLAKVFNESAWRIGSLVQKIEQDRSDLERAEGMFRGIAENSMVGVYIAHKGRFRYVNAKMAEMFGYSRAEMLAGVPTSAVFPGWDGDAVETSSRERIGGDVPGLWMERRGCRRDGKLIDLEIFGSIMTLDNEQVTIGIALDITRRKDAEAQVKLAMLVHHHSSEAMVVTDASGRLLNVNPAFTQITGYEAEEVIGKRLNILSSGRHDVEFYQAMWAEIQDTGCWEGDIWNRRKNGEIYAERLLINTCYDDDGAPRYRIGLFSDITKKKQAEELIWRQANYDHLTAVPNRQYFQRRLEQEMQRSDTTGKPMALVYLDLDDFKELNDTLGHGVGDKLLVELAQRLQSCVRSTDTVARLGGDEFVLVLGGLADTDVVDGICEHVMEKLAEPFLFETEQATVSASLGVTFYPQDGKSVKDLLQNADLAMYAAKGQGKHQWVRFAPAMQAHAAMRRQLSIDLATAVRESQFYLAYQPIVALASGRIEKVECLTRWQHPEKGVISPATFIPFAEDSGMINEIGEWVFRKAARQLARWQQAFPGLQASVNVSPVQFVGTHMSAKAWLDHLAALGLTGAHLVVEVTERLLLNTDDVVTSKLIAFRDAGVQIALDDFGTGYSSMSYLKRFDIDYIKIDQSFVRNLSPGSEDLVLCEAMIGMAHRLGLQVVAEGVETLEQRDLLLAAGCDFAQGYLFSPPVDAEAFEALMRERHIAVASSNRQSTTIG